jgi:hypothetical protein
MRAVLWFAAFGCAVPDASPRLLSVTPNEGLNESDHTIEIEVSGLEFDVRFDYGDPDRSGVVGDLHVYLDQFELAEARLLRRDRVSAVVPRGLPVGAYPVIVRDGRGRTATMENGYRAFVEPTAIANDDQIEVDEDGSALADLLANDLGLASLDGVEQPLFGSVAIVDHAHVRYTPNANYFGDDTFAYDAIAHDGTRVRANVAVTVRPMNDAPEATDLAYAASGPITIELIGSDVDGDALTFRVTSAPAAGTLSALGNSTLLYQPPPSAELPLGAVRFTYVASDGVLESREAGVTIAVSSPWWNAAWSARRGFVMQTFDGAFDDFAVLVTLDPTRIDYSKTSSGGADLRFVAGDQLTVLPHEIEKWDPENGSFDWVSLPRAQSGTTFWMYYGNRSAADAQQPGMVWNADYNAVWHLADDPTDSTLAGNHGTPQGALQVRGMIGDGRAFFGTTLIEYPPGLVSSGAGTLLLWARSPFFDFSYADHAIAFYATNAGATADGIGGEPELHLGFDPEPGFTSFFFFIEGGPDGELDDVRLRSPVHDDDGRWHSVVASWDLAAGTAELYVDGELRDTDTHRAFDFVATTAVQMGRPRQDIRNYYGALDEIRVLSTPQSSEWVAVHHRSMTDALLDVLPAGI